MGEINKNSEYQEGNNIPLEDSVIDSASEEYIDFSELISDEVFVGDTPFDTIISGIVEQFNDYINLEDRTNYVEIFYDQLEDSINDLNDEELTFITERKEALEKIIDKFNEVIRGLFKLRLALNIFDENDMPDDDVLQYRIMKSYEFFILNGRKNFKVAIAKDLKQRMTDVGSDDEFYQKVDDLLDSFYTPLITSITPIKFIEYTGDDDMLEMYQDGDVTGNFFRKYTPKLYQNDEFRCELISFITLTDQFSREMEKDGRSAE